MNSAVPAHPLLLSVCICTYKRPAGLIAALNSVAAQVLPAYAAIEIVVVDNDPHASANDVVAAFKQAHPALRLVYANEATPGVSFARNRCLREATGDWIAFLDDDETASANWLPTLLSAALVHKADAVFGPVLSVYVEAMPGWLADDGIVSRQRFDTGTAITWRDARTGNVLMARSLAVAVGEFDVRFAKTGGEDSLFFATAQKLGFRMVWCDEATVNETVPPARMTQRWVIQRAFFGGRTFTRLNAALYGHQAYVKWFVHGMAMFAIYAVPALVMWVFNRKGWLHYVRKLAGATGKMAAPFYDGGEYGQV